MEFVEHSAAAEKPDEAPQERPSGQPKAEQESSVIEALPPAGDASIAAEREPVEDTYFDDAVFLGDSRTEGFTYTAASRPAHTSTPPALQWSRYSASRYPRLWDGCRCWTHWKKTHAASSM